MRRRTLGPHAQPQRLLFAHFNAERQLIRRQDAPRSKSALIQHIFRVDVREMVVDHPANAVSAVVLFVRGRKHHDIPRGRDPGPLQRRERHHLFDADALHIHGAAAPHLAVLNHRRERVDLPRLAVHWHHVQMVQQQ